MYGCTGCRFILNDKFKTHNGYYYLLLFPKDILPDIHSSSFSLHSPWISQILYLCVRHTQDFIHVCPSDFFQGHSNTFRRHFLESLKNLRMTKTICDSYFVILFRNWSTSGETHMNEIL